MLEKYYIRYRYVQAILDYMNNIPELSTNPSIRQYQTYELRNILERLMLTKANENTEVLTYNDTGISQFRKELSDKIKGINNATINAVVNYAKECFKLYNSITTFVDDRIQLKIGEDFVSYREYKRSIDRDRIKLLLSLDKNSPDPQLNLGKMVMCYASILPGAQHWNASENHYRKYLEHGIRLEGFASPINAQMIAIDPTTHFCSLFPEVDRVYGSIGNFFDITFGGKVAVGPPYTAEMFNRIVEVMLNACAKSTPVRFYFTHANWSDLSGYQKLLSSPYMIYHEVVEKNKHYYMNTNVSPNEQIIAKFETVLFVVSNYKDNEVFTDLLDGLKLSKVEFNPPLVFTDFLVPTDSPFLVTVVRDDKLVGGTKQRALSLLIDKHKDVNDEFVYAGPATGYAQIALAYVCSQKTNVKATIFIMGTQRTKLTETAEKYGAKLYFIAGDLAKTEEMAKRYIDSPKKFLVPFGVDSDEYRDLLFQQLNKVWIESGRVPPKRCWMTFGSGTILKVLGQLWPNTEFMPVRVGKNIWEDMYTPDVWRRMGGRERIDMLRVTPDDKLAPVPGHQYQRFTEDTPAELLPPFSAVRTYDAKVWQRVLQYGQSGDMIWCVGSEIF